MTRPVVAFAACAALLAGCATRHTNPPTTTPSRPLRVLVVGNSVAAQIGVAYAGAFAGSGLVDVHNDAKPGTSRFGDDTIDHLTTTWTATVTTFDPQIVIVQAAFRHSRFACNGTPTDQQACTDASIADENAHTAAVLTSTLAAHGAHIIWVPFLPASNGASAAEQVDATGTNTAVAATAARDHRIEILSLPVPAVSDRWIHDVDGWHQARSTDGIHLCPWGAEQIVAALAARIDPAGIDILEPGWRHGTWWADVPYTRTATGTTPMCSNDTLPARPATGE